MFCPRARLIFHGVGVCAFLVGCAAAPSTQSTSVSARQVCPPPTEPLASAVQSPVISADALPLSRPVTCEDIINWSVRGVHDDVIIDRLAHSSNVFHLTAADEVHLRDAGVSDEVIRAMKATAS